MVRSDVSLCGLASLYVNTVGDEFFDVSSFPLTFFTLIPCSYLCFPAVLVWKHNSAQKKRFAEWDSSFICSRCGHSNQHSALQSIQLDLIPEGSSTPFCSLLRSNPQQSPLEP